MDGIGKRNPAGGKRSCGAKRKYALRAFMKTALPLAAWQETPLVQYTRLHSHDCYEMVVIRSGSGWCAINGRRFPMLYGDVFILTPQDEHEFHHRHELDFYNIMFSRALLNKRECAVLEPLLRQGGRYTCSISVSEQLQALLATLVQTLDRRAMAGVELVAKGLFLEALALLLEADAAKPEAGEETERGRAALLLNRLSNSPRKRISLKELATELDVCREYAGKLVRQLTGVSLAEYLRVRRMDLALHELAMTSKTITDIAFSFGFYDAADFNKQFHRVMGCAPGAYRKQVLGG